MLPRTTRVTIHSPVTPDTSMPARLRPAGRVDGLPAYRPPANDTRVELSLDANEGAAPDATVSEVLRGLDAEALRRYPTAAPLERTIGEAWSIDAARVIVTSGGDDAIDRACRAMLEPGRTLVQHIPTFAMIERSAHLAGASIRSVAWMGGAAPVDDLLKAIRPGVGLVALVSPNNPTGGTIGCSELTRIARAAMEVGAATLVDLAYVEFADEDPTAELLRCAGVVVVRTFSKALGLAGLRVGYALGDASVIEWMRAAGGPYPVSAVSLACAGAAFAMRAMRRGMIERVRWEREAMLSLLDSAGIEAMRSHGNFVLARFGDAARVRERLLESGVSVRGYAGDESLDEWLRITLPGDALRFDRLCRALLAAIDSSRDSGQQIVREGRSRQ